MVYALYNWIVQVLPRVSETTKPFYKEGCDRVHILNWAYLATFS